MREAKVALAAALVAVVAAVGCGGGDSSTEAATPSKAEFAKQIEKLCVRSERVKFHDIGVAAHEEGGAFSKKGGPTLADVEELTTTVVLPVFKNMTEEMREMTLPHEREHQIEEMISTFEADVQQTEKDPKRFVDGVAFEDGNAAAEALGFTQCHF